MIDASGYAGFLVSGMSVGFLLGVVSMGVSGLFKVFRVVEKI